MVDALSNYDDNAETGLTDPMPQVERNRFTGQIWGVFLVPKRRGVSIRFSDA